MKLNIRKIYMALPLAALFFTGCNSDPDYYSLESPTDQMHVKASSDSLVLEKAMRDEEAVTFSWNDATDRGTDTELTYFFRLYLADETSNVSETVKLADGVRSITYTTREINDLLTAWNINPGDEVKVVGEVIAKVTASRKYMLPEISTTEMKVTGYNTKNVMYLFTRADGKDQPIVMQNGTDDDTYYWSGQLEPCKFWFSADRDNGYPAYMKGQTDNTVTYSKTGTGDMFSVDETSNYYITLDVTSGIVNVKKIPILYMVTERNSTQSVITMNNFQAGSKYYHWSGTLQAGTQIKFSTSSLGGWPAYVPDASDNTKLVNSDTETAMLNITKTAKYEVTVDLENDKLVCLSVLNVPGLYGTGRAFPIGAFKNTDTSYPFVQTDVLNHPEMWSCTADITANQEFKIVTLLGQWNQEIVSASSTDKDPINKWLTVGQRGLDVSGDNKFIPTQGGIWTIKLDLHNMRLTMIQE